MKQHIENAFRIQRENPNYNANLSPQEIAEKCKLNEECQKYFDSKDDIAALNHFEELFPGMEVIPIYAKPLVKGKKIGGGALHCVTWEYIEKKE